MKEFKKINKESIANRILITREIFLRGLSFIYLISFLSLYGQIQGLWGNEGILPANLFLSRLKESLKNHKYYLYYPTLGWLFNLKMESNSVENLLFILCITGIIISFLIISNNKYVLNSFGFIILWYIYYNFNLLGQAFMKYAWDNLLSEIGFAAIFFAPLTFKSINYINQINNISFYVLKFILAKFMISTGINIIGSLCPYWTSFSGLNFFFQGQPLLSSFSYFLNFCLGETAKKILSAFGYFCVLYLPLGYFLVWRRFSIYAGEITFLFNLFFIFAGNYGFINLLIITLNVLNFDDYFFRTIFTQKTLNFLGVDHLMILVPQYIQDRKEQNILVNNEEQKLQEIKNKMDNEKDKEKLSKLNVEYNQLRQKIYEIIEDESDDYPKIETTLKVDSTFLRECFIFCNFLCANILFVYLFLYPIKRLVQGMAIIEETTKQKFKTSIIVFSIYVFIYINICFFINLMSNVKNSILSDKGMMNSVINEMMEKNKKMREEENKEKNEENKNDENKDKKNEKNKKPEIENKMSILKKIPKLKVISYAFISLFKLMKFFGFILLFIIYFTGSVKYFLLNMEIDLIEDNSSSKKKDKNKLDNSNSSSSLKNLVAVSDILFGNYGTFGTYGNIQEEILSVSGKSEIEIEYTNPTLKNWKTVNFEYKLGPENINPKFLFFHTPRIDWKMFLSAKEEDLNSDTWLVILLGKIIQKNPVVLDLLGYDINEKKWIYDNSMFEKMKQAYLGRSKYDMIYDVEKIKIDIYKYQFIKPSDIKKNNSIFKRKRYKEYLSQIEKYAVFLIYDKLGLPKPDSNKNIKINKFQFVPVYDLIVVFILIKMIIKNK